MYEPNFFKSFNVRTQEIVNSYSGPRDATLFLNCLLGLLVLPKEAALTRLPEDPDLEKWGIPLAAIVSMGTTAQGAPVPCNLRNLVHRLRNAVAHFRIEPLAAGADVAGFRFRDSNGFDASINLDHLKDFSLRLSKAFENSA
jgi:hypothetical protein